MRSAGHDMYQAETITVPPFHSRIAFPTEACLWQWPIINNCMMWETLAAINNSRLGMVEIPPKKWWWLGDISKWFAVFLPSRFQSLADPGLDMPGHLSTIFLPLTGRPHVFFGGSSPQVLGKVTPPNMGRSWEGILQVFQNTWARSLEWDQTGSGQGYWKSTWITRIKPMSCNCWFSARSHHNQNIQFCNIFGVWAKGILRNCKSTCTGFVTSKEI